MSMERAHINTDIYKVLSKICNNQWVEISMRLASTGIVICTVPICLATSTQVPLLARHCQLNQIIAIAFLTCYVMYLLS